MTFREEVEKVLTRTKGKISLERTLNAIESAHRRHRNIEIKKMKEEGKL